METVRNSAGAEPSHRVDRRTAINWILSATAVIPLVGRIALSANAQAKPTGYGPDPDVQKTHKPGELWPLTFTPEQRRTATILCDTIIPADDESPSASEVGVVAFIDEWISAPYSPRGDDFGFALDRALLLEGLTWLNGESVKRFGKAFSDLDETQRTAICDDICYLKTAKPEYEQPARFFARFRDLTSGGFYTTPQGSKAIGYVGNVPLATFEGPPIEVLRKVGLA